MKNSYYRSIIVCRCYLTLKDETFTVRDRILMHILETLQGNGGRKDTYRLTQYGISESLALSRAHVAIELERGTSRGMFYSERARIRGIERDVKVYLLTDNGMKTASELINRRGTRRLIQEALRTPGAVSVSEVTARMEQKDLLILCALRIAGMPLNRRALEIDRKIPFTIPSDPASLSLMDMAYEAVDSHLQDESIRKFAYGLLADYFLRTDDYCSRMKYLLLSGRLSEADRTVAFHSREIEACGDAELRRIVIESARSADKCDGLLVLASRYCISEGDWQCALELSRSCGSECTEALLLYAESCVMGGRISEGKRALDRLRRDGMPPRNLSSLHRISARIALSYGGVQEAEYELGEALHVSTASADVHETIMNYSLLAVVARQKEDYREAARIEAKMRSLANMNKG